MASYFKVVFKGTFSFSGLRQFETTENPLKVMKNAFYFTSKALFILKMFKFLSWHFSHAAKPLDQNNKVDYKFYDITAWLANNRNTYMMMTMMMMIMMLMSCFCGMVDRRKAISLISSRDHCQRSSPLWISAMPRAEFEPAQNLSSGLVK